jgi:erythromycin esterase-like protein
MVIETDRLRQVSIANQTLLEKIKSISYKLQNAYDLDPLMEQIGDARFVLLGEASHGTSEYYQWRARLSQRLIREKGFSFIAVEGDWPDCYRVNRYVKGYPDSGQSAREVLHSFARWPTWMWANWEIVALAEDVELSQGRGQRAIGVVYNPEYEAFGNYVPTTINKRYDALLYFEETQALHPLHIQPETTEPPETYPWGL